MKHLRITLLATVFAAPFALVACTQAQIAKTAGLTAKVEAEAAQLVTYYPVAKGLVVAGEVAATAEGQPALAAVLAAGLVKTDAAVTQLQTAETDANADETAVTALIQQVTAQVQTLVTQAAPVVKVVPASTSAAP